jgi:trehalose/maltose hydrolase-like predicted phosphorylase
MSITKNQLERLQIDMEKIAKNKDIKAEIIKGFLYVFGSELDVLRIFANYLAKDAMASDKYRVNYSENLKSHFFSFELAA